MLPVRTLAWGDKGHVIVAHLASRLLTTSARHEVAALLGAGESLVSVAVWADEIRGSYNNPGPRPETARWHFVDVPLGADYDAVRDCPETPNGGCVIAALVMFQDVLAKKRAGYYVNSRYEALKFIVHLMGDVHQPLHCATDDDFGGNLKMGVWIDGSIWKLHAVWDETILAENMKRRNTVAPIPYAERLLAELTDQQRGDARPTPSSMRTMIGRRTIEAWAKESHAIAGSAYADLGPRDANDRYHLTEAYYDHHRKEVDDQLKRAGIRLARILNENLR